MPKIHPISREAAAHPKRSRTSNDSAGSGIGGESEQREKPLSLAEALREQGLDDRALARVYIELLDRFLQNGDAKSSEKTLVDLIKEITRVLQPVAAANSVATTKARPDTAVVVRLLHDVPRPVRNRIGEAIDVPVAAAPTVE